MSKKRAPSGNTESPERSETLFYSNLPGIERFEDVFDEQIFTPVPSSWYVALTDIVDSTIAIHEGRYKEVNAAGSIAAMAISNLKDDMDFPFIFGGDGMVYLIPPVLVPQVKDVLADTRNTVKETMGFNMRAALVPVSDIINAGHDLSIARLETAERFTQAVIAGSGIQFADTLVKDEEKGGKYIIPESHIPETKADFNGFTCRWEDIPSVQGETLSLILQNRKGTKSEELFKAVYEKIENIIGKEEEYHPLTEGQMRLAENRDRLSIEARVLSKKKSGFLVWVQTVLIRLQIMVVSFVTRFNISLPFRGKNLKQVRQDNLINSDFRKYDGTLRMVISCTTQSRKRLVKLLETLKDRGYIYYGIHISNRALLTCLIHYGSRGEVHFVDAADGGYALAAKMLKKQQET